MKFLVDESADARLASYLAGLGHDATLIARTYGPGLPDEQVLAVALAEGRTLITDDRDLRSRPRRPARCVARLSVAGLARR